MDTVKGYIDGLVIQISKKIGDSNTNSNSIKIKNEVNSGVGKFISKLRENIAKIKVKCQSNDCNETFLFKDYLNHIQNFHINPSFIVEQNFKGINVVSVVSEKTGNKGVLTLNDGFGI